MGVALIERKRDFKKLISLMEPLHVDPEVKAKLDLIVEAANSLSSR